MTKRFPAILPIFLLVLSVACVKPPVETKQAALAMPTPSALTAAAAPTESPQATAEPSPEPVAAEPIDESPVVEFSLPKFKVSGKVVLMGIDPKTNVMQTPDNKDDVAVYDFAPHPGTPCIGAGQCANTVLSAHVDWYTGQVGIFWHLKDLSDGDEIRLKLESGKILTYRVAANTIYKTDEAPVTDIIGDTPEESVTLITCDGVFNKSLHEYNARRVVRAVRNPSAEG